MVSVSFVFNLTALYVAAAAVLCLLAHALYIRHRDRRDRRAMRRVAEVASAFMKSEGIEAYVTSYPVLGGRRFVALVEAKPTERLGSSQQIEAAAIEKVREETGLIVERVFWRFPIPALGNDRLRNDLALLQGVGGVPRGGGDADAVARSQFDAAVQGLKPLRGGMR